MNTFKNILLAGSISLACISAQAQPLNALQPYSYFATGATNGNTALSYVIASAHSVNNGFPVVTALSATSDTLAAAVAFYKVIGQSTVTYTNSTTTVYVNNTNSMPTSATVIIRHIGNDTYEKRICTTGNAGSTNIVLTTAPYTCSPGDIVYSCTTNGAGRFTVVTNNGLANASFVMANSGGIYVGQKGLPLLVEIQGASLSSIQLMAVKYEP